MMKSKLGLIGSLITLLVLVIAVALARAQGPQPPQRGDVEPQGNTSIQTTVSNVLTYQGHLKKNGSAVNDTCDFEFSLWNAASDGEQVGGAEIRTGVQVSNGYFTIPDLEFPGAFHGEARWLQVAVKCTGETLYTTLSPRQTITAVPYALGLRPGVITSGPVSGPVLSAQNTSSGGINYGLHGMSTSFQGIGVAGWATAGSGNTYGVSGVSASTDGTGVHGRAYAPSGTTYGMYGQSDSTAGRGVYGYASAASGETYGVYGRSASADGRGVFGEATATSGVTYGVLGRSSSTEGRGMYGWASATSGLTYGVLGRSDSSDGRGVYGVANATSGETYGVYGVSNSTAGRGVYGVANATSGETYGVYGVSNSTAGRGVYGAVYATNGTNYGVYGQSESPDGIGVYGRAAATSGINYGVYAWTDSPSGFGLYAANIDGFAGYLWGNMHISGDLDVTGSKAFKIDHPLDPANRYLYHFAQEAPEVQNVYNGVVTLDARGEATVNLPAYFAALNTGPFRYQLTAIGAPMPNLYIAQEIQGNTFRIAGGVPGKKVSWEVTAVRNDPYLHDHPVQAEVDKPAGEQGTYLYPAGYGQPPQMGLDYQRNASLGQP